MLTVFENGLIFENCGKAFEWRLVTAAIELYTFFSSRIATFIIEQKYTKNEKR